jgi:hypothetical protein
VTRVGNLDRRVEVRATPEALRLQPLRGRLEEQQDPVLGVRGRGFRLGEDTIEPSRTRIAQPGDDEVVLRRKVAIERRLGDAGLLDQAVDAGRADPGFVTAGTGCGSSTPRASPRQLLLARCLPTAADSPSRNMFLAKPPVSMRK